jgi:hypothetical protein
MGSEVLPDQATLEEEDCASISAKEKLKRCRSGPLTSLRGTEGGTKPFRETQVATKWRFGCSPKCARVSDTFELLKMHRQWVVVIAGENLLDVCTLHQSSLKCYLFKTIYEASRLPENKHTCGSIPKPIKLNPKPPTIVIICPIFLRFKLSPFHINFNFFLPLTLLLKHQITKWR